MKEHEAEDFHVGDLSPGTIALLKNIADEAAERTVRRFSIAMGIDPNDPMRAQRNMQWLDRSRTRWEGAHGKALMTAIGIAVIGAGQAAWTGFKAILAVIPVPPAH